MPIRAAFPVQAGSFAQGREKRGLCSPRRDSVGRAVPQNGRGPGPSAAFFPLFAGSPCKSGQK